MTAQLKIFDDRACFLGEGPLWHPERAQLFWFDIENFKLMSVVDGLQKEWAFDRYVSAGAWIDRENLLIASETGLIQFNLENGTEKLCCEIEADNPLTRSNDGRADPWGGFWMGTMSKAGEIGQGTLYRWLPDPNGGELRVLAEHMSTPNSICFDHNRSCAYFADTKTRIIWRQPVDPETGWPCGDKVVFVDLRETETASEHKPDGAVIDAEGCLWSAQWGSARVARYSPNGEFLLAVELPTGHTSCPAIGGQELNILYVTTAMQKLPDNRPDWQALAGQTFACPIPVAGRAEPRILL